MSHLSHLRTFLEAYRSGSFSKAAELLGITQPAASQHIQSLETLVGKRLFIRQARGVTATEAADELARSVSPFIDGLEEKLSSFRSGSVRGGTINLAGPPDFIHSRLGTVMAPLMKEGYSEVVQHVQKDISLLFHQIYSARKRKVYVHLCQ